MYRSLSIPKLVLPGLLIGLCAVGAHAQADTAKETTGNEVAKPFVASKSKIKGRAIFDDTGLPAVDALVSLVNPKSPRPLGGMTTNERGTFGLGGMPPGEYYVVVQPMEEFGSGYPSIPNPFRTGDEEFDAARLEAFTRGFPKVTVDGTNLIELEIRIPRTHGGVISGRITGVSSGAVAHTSVSILRQLHKGLSIIESVRTGADGAFRVTRLPPGEYFVRAIDLDKNELADAGEVELPNAVYFAAAKDIKDAVPVTVLPEQESASINISLEMNKRATVSGLLRMRPSGKPLTNVMVMLRGREGRDHVINSDENGRWSFSHVASGVYTLQVGTIGISPPFDASRTQLDASRPQPFVHKYQQLTVGESDINDIVVELLEGGRISGTVILEGKGTSKPGSIIITADSLAGDGQNPGAARVSDYGVFNLVGVPLGQVTLRASTFPGKEYVTKSIQWNGVDLLKEKLDVVESTDIRNVVIVIAPAPH